MLLLDQMTNHGIQMSFVGIDDQLIGFIAWPRRVQMNIHEPDIGTAEMNIFRCVLITVPHPLCGEMFVRGPRC